MRSLGPALAALLLAMPAAAQVAEPPSLWTGPMQSDTPATLSGAQVVDAETVARLKDNGAILLDMASSPPRPEKLAENATWMPVHLSIPGAIWLPGAGLGSPDPALQARFNERVEALTRGDKNMPIVTFCHQRCWGSWNAGKRLVMLGYKKVFWFPGGAESWQDKFAAAPVGEDEDWRRSAR